MASIDRRQFLTAAGLVLTGAARSSAQPNRKLKIGHTGITWGFKPEDAAGAIRDAGALGYMGYETFGEVLEAWEPKGGLKRVLDENRLPLISAYCNVNLTDPAKRADEIARAVLWAKLIKQNGGVTAVIGPNGVKRASYDFKASKSDIIAALNEICKAVADNGIIPALHQHTGTCIESSRRSVRSPGGGGYARREVRAGCGTTRQGRSRPREGREGFPPAYPPRAFEGLEWRLELGGILSAGRG